MDVVVAAGVVVVVCVVLAVVLPRGDPVVVHLERAALEHFAVKELNRLARRVLVLKRHQCKPQAVAHVVGLDLDVRHGATAAQVRLELVPRRGKRNIADKQPLLVNGHVREVHDPRLVPAAVCAVVAAIPAVAAKAAHPRHMVVRHKPGVEGHAEHGRGLGPIRRHGGHVVGHGGVSKGGGARRGDRVGGGRCGLRGGGVGLLLATRCKVGFGHGRRARVEGYVLRHVWHVLRRPSREMLGRLRIPVLVVAHVHAHGVVRVHSHLHLMVDHGLVLQHHGLLRRQRRLRGQHKALHVVALQLGRQLHRHLGSFHLDVGDARHHNAHHAPAWEDLIDDVFDASPGGCRR